MASRLNEYDIWPFPKNFSFSFLSKDFCYLDFLVKMEFYEEIKNHKNNYCSMPKDFDDMEYLALFGVCLGQCSVTLTNLYPLCCCFNRQLPDPTICFDNFRVIVPRSYPPLKRNPNKSPMVLQYFHDILSEFLIRLRADREYNLFKTNVPKSEISNINNVLRYRHDIEYFSSCWRFYLRKKYLELTKSRPERVGR